MNQIGSQGACQLRVEANGPRTSSCPAGDPRSLHQVAQEFESLLIEQILKSVKLGEMSEDSNGTGGSMMELAQENLARLISQNGGLGVGHFLETALNQTGAARSTAAASPPTSSGPHAPDVTVVVK
jgi:Rod binding domain-containing protein